MALFETLFLLFCGHALGDFALQNDFTATNKNRHERKKYSPEQQAKMEVIWPWLLSAHAMHHGLIVYFITQNFAAGLAETVLHGLIDFGKCERLYNFHTDQVLHLITKVIWVAMIYYGWM